jgi:hypothetical protein
LESSEAACADSVKDFLLHRRKALTRNRHEYFGEDFLPIAILTIDPIDPPLSPSTETEVYMDEDDLRDGVSFTVWIDPGDLPESSELCECDDCGWVGPFERVVPMDRYGVHLNPDEPIPLGRCPECGEWGGGALVDLIMLSQTLTRQRVEKMLDRPIAPAEWAAIVRDCQDAYRENASAFARTLISGYDYKPEEEEGKPEQE